MNTIAFKLLNSDLFVLKVNPLLRPFNVIKELLLFNGIPYEIWTPDYNKETAQWNYSFIEMGFCRGCNFQDVYLLAYILKDFGLTFIYPAKDNTNEIFLGTNIDCLENPENLALRKPMHIQDFIDIDPKLKIEEIIDLFSSYPYSNDQGYSKEEMQEFEKEYWEGAGEQYSEEDTFDALMDRQLGDYEDFERETQNKALLIHYSPDDVMTKGINKEYSLKDNYQYMPKYLEWCIKYWQEFEIEVNDFKNLPNPTIPNPQSIPSDNRLKFYPKIEYSIKGILNYIKKGGIKKEIEFNFSNETLEILELKRKGQYTAPEFIKPVAMSSEEVDRILHTLQGTFYAIEKYCINYIRFYSDKTVITITVSSKSPSDEILKWFNKENSNVGIGKYILNNAKINFTIIEPRTKRKMEYSGEGILKDSFLFYIKSSANGNETKSIYKLLPPSDKHITQNIPSALIRIKFNNEI